MLGRPDLFVDDRPILPPGLIQIHVMASLEIEIGKLFRGVRSVVVRRVSTVPFNSIT